MALKCPSCGDENRDDALFCGMCKMVFRKEKPSTPAAAKPAAPKPPATQLAYDQIAADFANDPYAQGFGVLADYSAASLLAVDEMLTELYGTAGEQRDRDDWDPTPGKRTVIIRIGAYFGETLRRLFGGAWQDDPQHPGKPLFTQLLLSAGGHVFPLARVFKRLKNGSEDDLFSVFVMLRQKLAPNGVPDEAESFFRQAERFAASGRPIADKFYDYAVKLDPSLATRARYKPPAREIALSEEGVRPQPKAPRDPSLVLVDPPYAPERAATADDRRAAAELFQRAGLREIARRLLER